MRLDFVKMHGTGNDFVMLDARELELDWPALAQKMCDRHLGIGADGIILVQPSSKAPLRMRIFNADGSEAEMCGNGIRCFARFAIERGMVGEGQFAAMPVETGRGVLTVYPKLEDGVVNRVRVNMGRPILEPERVPVKLEAAYQKQHPQPPVMDYPLQVDGVKLALTFVSMGNPHAVAFMDTPVKEFPLAAIGPKVEHHPIFPRRTNFEVANAVDRGHVRVRVWERGVGETLACGSGVCAVAVAARLHNLAGDKMEMEAPGGRLKLEWDGKGDVWLEGPVAKVFTGQWE